MKKVGVLLVLILTSVAGVQAQLKNVSDSLINQVASRSSNTYSTKDIRVQGSLKQDSYSCAYFTSKNKAILQKVILDQLVEFRCKIKDCTNAFIRHWKFTSAHDALSIETEANKYSDGEGMPIKEPHLVIRVKYDVYVIYVLAEGNRSQLDYFKKILKPNP